MFVQEKKSSQTTPQGPITRARRKQLQQQEENNNNTTTNIKNKTFDVKLLKLDTNGQLHGLYPGSCLLTPEYVK